MAGSSYPPVFCIDFGCYKSCLAAYRHEKVEIDLTRTCLKTTKSEVTFHELSASAKSILAIKCILGRVYNDKVVQSHWNNLLGDVVEALKNPRIKLVSDDTTRLLSAEEVSSIVLRPLIALAKNQGQDDISAVVTVPSSFRTNQRQAMLDACKIAGFDPLMLMSEQIAAAIAYSYFQDKLDATTTNNVLIFDLGGGHFHSSLIAVQNENYQVLSTVGEANLGGMEFVKKIFNYCTQEFQLQQSVDYLTSNEKLALLHACEKSMSSLDIENQTDINFHFSNENRKVTLTRQHFDELTLELVLKVRNLLEVLMKDSNIEKSLVHCVVLVGGASRIPAIHKMLKEMFQSQIISTELNAEEAVAVGGSIYAASLKGYLPKPILVKDMVAHSLGIGCNLNWKDLRLLIERRSPIPSVGTCVIRTFNSNTITRVKIFEDEVHEENGYFTGHCHLPPRPFPIKIRRYHLEFSVDMNGLLNVVLADELTGDRIPLRLSRYGCLKNKEMQELLSKVRLSSQLPEKGKNKCSTESTAVSSNLIKNGNMLNCIPFSLGVGFGKKHKSVTIVVDRKTLIPVRISRMFRKKNVNQTKMLIKVYAGESVLREKNLSIGEISLFGLSKATRLQITFDLDKNSTLKVEAKEENSAVKGTLEILLGEALRKEDIINIEEVEEYSDCRRVRARKALLNFCKAISRKLKEDSGDPSEEKLLLAAKVGEAISFAATPLHSEDQYEDIKKSLKELLMKVHSN